MCVDRFGVIQSLRSQLSRVDWLQQKLSEKGDDIDLQTFHGVLVEELVAIASEQQLEK